MNKYEIFVSVSGKNNGDGSISNPFADLRQAVLSAEKCDGEKVIYIREGKYFFDSALQLTPANNHLFISAYQNEKVIFSGSKRLRDVQWKEYEPDKRIKYTFAGAGLFPDQLFINGKAQILARFPTYMEGVLPLGGGSVSAKEIKEGKGGNIRKQGISGHCMYMAGRK